MEIKLLGTEDYDKLYRLWMDTPGMGLNDVDDSREGIARYLNRNPTTCFAAWEQEELVGCILSGHDGRRGIIYHTAVKGDCQGQGIGSALVDRAVKALKEEGIHKVMLVVFRENQKGNTFWQAKGFDSREDLIYRNRALSVLHRIDT